MDDYDICDTNEYPEDPWTRVTKLEQQVAKLEQQAEERQAEWQRQWEQFNAEERDAVIKRLLEALHNLETKTERDRGRLDRSLMDIWGIR